VLAQPTSIVHLNATGINQINIGDNNAGSWGLMYNSLLHGLVLVPADENHGEVHGAHGEHEVEEAEAVGDVVFLLLLRLRLLELQVC
jgi:hypothetical protein